MGKIIIEGNKISGNNKNSDGITLNADRADIVLNGANGGNIEQKNVTIKLINATNVTVNGVVYNGTHLIRA